MGERWADLRESLHREQPDGVAFLRGALLDSGALLEPLGDELRPAGLHLFADGTRAAVVALLQACCLLGRERLPERLVRAGLACRDGDRMARELALLEVLPKIERFLHVLACRVEPKLADGGNLSDTWRALRKEDLLPLSAAELARWDADRDEVNRALAQRTKGEGRGKAKARGALWNRKARALFAERGVERSLPRYFALLELQVLRNAHAHGDTSAGQGIDLPLNSWRRMLGFLVLVAVRAFARGVLTPAPIPQPGASTISRPPPAEEPEPITATAELLEEPRPRAWRRWAFVTAAATVAVVAGTVAANLLASKSVGTQPPDALDAASSSNEAAATPRGPAVPPVQGFAPAGVTPDDDPNTIRHGQTRLCDVRRAEPLPTVLPKVAFTALHQRRGKRLGELLPRRAAAYLQGYPRLGSMVVLRASEADGREDLVRRIERTVCETRPVLAADDALGPMAPVNDALIVARLSGPDDPRLPRLQGLATEGKTPRVLLVVDAGVELRLKGSSSLLEPRPFDCAGAQDALAALSGSTSTDAGAELARWGLLPRTAAKAGQTCVPAPALRDLRGLNVVAAALARHDAPPADHDGTWRSWVNRAADGDPRVDLGAPAGELARAARAGELAQAASVDGPHRKRRKGCAAWLGGFAIDDPDLLAHLVGTPPGQRCLAFLVDGALVHELDSTDIAAAIDRGLGAGRWRSEALQLADKDTGKTGRRVAAVLAPLQ